MRQAEFNSVGFDRIIVLAGREYCGCVQAKNERELLLFIIADCSRTFSGLCMECSDIGQL